MISDLAAASGGRNDFQSSSLSGGQGNSYVFIGQFPQKSPMISGSFAIYIYMCSVRQGKASGALLVYVYTHITHTNRTKSFME